MEILLVELIAVLLPGIVLSFSIAYYRLRKTLSLRMVPFNIIFTHCSTGGLIAVRRCAVIPAIAALAVAVVLLVALSVTPLAEHTALVKRSIIVLPSGLVFYTWWGINLKKKCLKEKRVRDLYN